MIERVLRFAERGPAWAAYVDQLPRLVADLLGEWELDRDGLPTHGHCALVLPVLREGRPAMLKVGFVDDESEHEALALQRWGGRGAVQLLRADPGRGALLLERLQAEDLNDQWDLQACAVVGQLYRRLHIPAPPQLRALTDFTSRWLDDLRRLDQRNRVPLPPRLVGQAIALGRAFAADPASTGTLIHADLHYANVLAAEREPWLAIDPKPVSGDPHYEPEPMLRNRIDELAGDVRRGLRARFHALIDAAGLDEGRARDWVIVRAVLNASWHLHDVQAGTARLDKDWLTRCVTIAKAVQE